MSFINPHNVFVLLYHQGASTCLYNK